MRNPPKMPIKYLRTKGKDGKMKRSIAAAAAAGIGFALCAEQVVDTNDVVTLPPVVVYASRIGDAKGSMPAHVQVIDAKDISSSGAKDLPELLKKRAGVDIQSMNGNPMLTSIAMRGFGENAFGRVKVMLDGEDLNNVDMAPPYIASIPIWNVDRVEIIHGPSPVLHGDGAVAGVVNVVTDSHDYEKKTKITGRAGSQYTYGGTVQTKGGFESEGLLYSASYDYLQSDGYRRNSAYDRHVAYAGLRKVFENGSTVGIKANYQNALYELPGYLTYDQWKNSRRHSNDHDNRCRIWNYGLSLDSKMHLSDDQWLYVDGGFSRQYRDAKWGQYGYDNEYSLYSVRFSPRYVNEMDIVDFGNKFTAGIDYRHDYDGVTDRSGYNPPKYHFNRDRFAGFLHDEFFITEELSVVAGARLECIDNRWVGVQPWTGFSGMNRPKSIDWEGDYELGVIYRPIEDLRLFAKGARFHRSAFCDELSYAYNGNPIDPETGISLDIGGELRFLDEFTFDIDGYGSIMEDEIFLDPGPAYGMWFNRNSPSKTRRIGFDTGLSWLRDKFAEASVRYGMVYADFGSGEYHGKDVPFVPHHRIRAEAGYWLLDDLEIKGGYTFVGSQHLASDFMNEAGRHPSYFLFDIGLHYAPSWAEGWKASFTMDNLFDRNYCDYAGYYGYGMRYYYPAVGRSFMFTLSYEF